MSVLSIVSFIGIVPGLAQLDALYGLFTSTVPVYVDGLQVSVQGDVPVGSDLKFILQVNGVDQPGCEVTVIDGAEIGSITFGTAVVVLAGSTVGLRCSSVGLTSAGSWCELRMNCRLQYRKQEEK